MKRRHACQGFMARIPAAFRRLCVETDTKPKQSGAARPAAFRRLCVETVSGWRFAFRIVPAAFRRLCVETATKKKQRFYKHSSRL